VVKKIFPDSALLKYQSLTLQRAFHNELNHEISIAAFIIPKRPQEREEEYGNKQQIT
jgi:hypothetical protein